MPALFEEHDLTKLWARVGQFWLGIVVAAATALPLPVHAQAGRQPELLPVQQGPVFNVQTEFPNYFLARQWRGKRPDGIPQNILNEAQLNLEAALASIFNRLTVPVVTAGGELQNARYFDYLRSHLNPKVKVMPSGGVVRSVVSYVYAVLYRRMQANPNLDPNQILKEIADEKGDLLGFTVRGVGSDFDVLVDGPEDLTGEAINKITEITNSAETKYDARAMKGDHKRSIFTVGDTKPYDEQIGLATRQGGSVVDFLAFDVEAGRFRLPQTHSYIVQEMLSGWYRYVAPASGEKQKDSDKQTVRGIRPLLELPFLSVLDDEQFKQELLALIEKVNGGSEVSEKALDQFNKIVRNARFSGAHNRLYRGGKQSLESLILQLNDLIYAKYRKTVIPEFVDSSLLEIRSARLKSELNGFPRELLVPVNQFIKEHTAHGFLYHGTRTLTNAMSILRGGLIVSGGHNLQGGYAQGTGGYSSPSEDVARSYAASEGFVFQLAVKRDARINILRADTAHPFMDQVRAEAKKLKIDFHQYLARHYGIDLLLNTNGVVLILNVEAFDMKNDVGSLIAALKSRLTANLDKTEPREMFIAYKEYQMVYSYAKALGMANVPEAEPIGVFIARLKNAMEANKPAPYAREEEMKLLRAIYEKQPALLKDQPWILQHTSREVLAKIIPDSLIDRKLAARVKDWRLKSLKTAHLAEEIAEHFPFAFLETYPDWPQAFKGLRNLDEKTFNGSTPPRSEVGRLFWQITQNLQSKKSLNEDERAAIRYLVRHFRKSERDINGPTLVLATLINNADPASRDWIATLLRGNHHAMLSLVAFAGRVNTDRMERANLKAIYQPAFDFMNALLGRDLTYRATILKTLRDDLFGSFSYEARFAIAGFPFTKRIPGDLAFIKEFYTPETKAGPDFESMRAEVFGQAGFSLTDNFMLSSVSSFAIGDQALRDRFNRARIVHEYADVFETILNRISPDDRKPEETPKQEFDDRIWRLTHQSKDKKLKDLDGSDLAFLRQVLSTPITDGNRKIIWEMLGGNEEMRRLTLNRISNPKAGDDPIALLMIANLHSLRGSIQFNQSLLKPEFRTRLLAAFKATTHLYGDFHDLDWRIDRDFEILGVLINKFYLPDFKGRKVEFLSDLYKSQPNFFTEGQRRGYLEASWLINISTVDEATVRDPALALRLAEIRRFERSTGITKSLLFQLAQRDPEKFAARFPALPHAAREYFNGDEAFRKRIRLPLAYLVRHSAGNNLLRSIRIFGSHFSASNAAERREILTAFKSGGDSGRLLTLSAFYKNNDPTVEASLKDLRQGLRQTIAADPLWRQNLFTRMESLITEDHGGISFSQAFENFPWDEQRDQLALKRLNRMIATVRKDIPLVIEQLGKIYGLRPDYTDEEQALRSVRSPELIADPLLRKRFYSALSIAGLKSRAKDYPSGWRTEKIANQAAEGLTTISAEDSKSVRDLLKGPIDRSTAERFRALLSTPGPLRDLALKRIARLQDGDQPIVLIRPDTHEALKDLWNQPRILARLQQEILASGDLYFLSDFPWDEKRDRAFLRALIRKYYVQDLDAQKEAFFKRLHDAQPGTLSTPGYWNFVVSSQMFNQDNPGLALYASKVKEEYLTLSRKVKSDWGIQSLMREFAKDHTKFFVENFADLPVLEQPLSHPSVKMDGDRPTLERASLAANFYLEIYLRLRTNDKISLADQKAIRYLIRHAGTENTGFSQQLAIAISLASEKSRAIIFDWMKDEGKAGELAAIGLLAENYWGSFHSAEENDKYKASLKPSLTAALNADLKWRARILKTLASVPERSPHAARGAVKSFPWNTEIEADVLFLKKFGIAPATAKNRLLDIAKELWRKDGFQPATNDLLDAALRINHPSRIPNEDRRNRFIEARAIYNINEELLATMKTKNLTPTKLRTLKTPTCNDLL